MTPKVKQIRDAMVEAVCAINNVDYAKSFLFKIGDDAAKELIQEAEIAAAKKIAAVADAIIMNVDQVY